MFNICSAQSDYMGKAINFWKPIDVVYPDWADWHNERVEIHIHGWFEIIVRHWIRSLHCAFLREFFQGHRTLLRFCKLEWEVHLQLLLHRSHSLFLGKYSLSHDQLSTLKIRDILHYIKMTKCCEQWDKYYVIYKRKYHVNYISTLSKNVKLILEYFLQK